MKTSLPGVLLLLYIIGSLLVGCAPSEERDRGDAEPALSLRLPEVPRMITDPEEQRCFLLLHFWETNEAWLSADSAHLMVALADYIALFRGVDEAVVSQSVAALVTHLSEDPHRSGLLRRSVSSMLYDPVSPLYSETDYRPFVEALLRSSATPEGERERLRFELSQILKNYPGTRATDFGYLDLAGRSHRLSRLLSSGERAILIFFYHPDCSGCDQAVSLLRSAPQISEGLESGRLTLLTLATGGTEEAWREKAAHFDPRWIVGRNVMDFEGIELYDFRAMPTYYLLSGDGTVLIKDRPLPVILKSLSHL